MRDEDTHHMILNYKLKTYNHEYFIQMAQGVR